MRLARPWAQVGVALAAILVVVLKLPRLDYVWPGNAAGLAAVRGLLGGQQPDEAQLERGRQNLYRALDRGLAPGVFAERIGNLEAARWQRWSEALLRQGAAEAGSRAFTYAAWTRVHFERLVLEPRLLERGEWLPAAQGAEQLQLWSLAAYLYARAAQAGAAPREYCLGQARALIELQQAARSASYLDCALKASPAPPVAHWLLAESLAQQGRWSETAEVLAKLAVEHPAVVNTPEAAALAGQVKQHTALDVPTAVWSAWENQAGNLLRNGSFEAGYENWAMWPEPGSATLPDAGRAYAGVQSMRATFAGTHDVDYYQVFQSVLVEPGRTYSLTAQLWAKDFNGHLGLEVRAGDWLGGNTTQVTGNTRDWQFSSLLFQVPAGIHSVTITLRHYGGIGVLQGTVWVDDVLVMPVDAVRVAGS